MREFLSETVWLCLRSAITSELLIGLSMEPYSVPRFYFVDAEMISMFVEMYLKTYKGLVSSEL